LTPAQYKPKTPISKPQKPRLYKRHADELKLCTEDELYPYTWKSRPEYPPAPDGKFPPSPYQNKLTFPDTGEPQTALMSLSKNNPTMNA
jgi:hypothetical protein